jgi:hypothetical protein
MTSEAEFQRWAQLDKNQALTAQTLQGLVETVKSHGTRIENLESRRWPANTVSIVMMAIALVGFLATYLIR